MTRRVLLLAAIVALLAAPARATDHPVVGTKVIVVDKVAAAGKAKAVFVTKDSAIAKGVGTDPAAIEATLDVAFDSVHGAFLMPQGAAWLVNEPSVAKYVNTDAPTGGAVKIGVVKPAKLIKVVARSLGEDPVDVSLPPSGTVYAAYTVVNGGDTHRHCTQFDGCVHKAIAHGSGHKLVCRGGSTADAGCQAVPTITTTTSSTTTTTTLQIAGSVDCCQGAGACVAGYGFSLNYYLMQYCSIALPGSSGVPGGVCNPSGTCEVQSIPPSTLCCQTIGSCYDSGTAATNTAQVWSFRNYCVGGLFGTAYYDAVCGPGGTCVAD